MAILVGVTVLALGVMVVAVGGVVEEASADADIQRVTADFERAFRAVETTGRNRATVQFGSGSLTTEPRTLRVTNDTGVVEVHDVDAVVYRPDSAPGAAPTRQVIALGGAVLVTHGDHTRVVRPPPIASGSGVLVVGIPVYHGTANVGGNRLSVTVQSDVTHARRTLGHGEWRVAIETTTPDAWNRTLTRRGGTLESPQDFDGDGIESVVARFPGGRTAHVVVHDVQLTVTT